MLGTEVAQTPTVAERAIHEWEIPSMLSQSWGGVITVFPKCVQDWCRHAELIWHDGAKRYTPAPFALCLPTR